MARHLIKCSFIFLAAILIAIAPVHAQKIPPHIATIASQLYKGIKDDLKSKKRDPQQQKILQDAAETLRDMGVHRWSTKPVRIDGDFEKAVEELQHSYTPEADNGRSLEMVWNPDTEKFTMKFTDDGSGGDEESVAIFSGDVKAEPSTEGQSTELRVNPSAVPMRAITKQDLEIMRGNILGEWIDEGTGETYVFTASDEEFGDILPPREIFDKQITELKNQITIIEFSKKYWWENAETGEIVKQASFRRLKEPFEYIGERYEEENGEEEIARLEKEIAALEKERDGGNLTPRDQYDPAGFGDMSKRKGAQPITVTVTREDGYTYTYDQAMFDGRRISAKRTYRDINDLDNKKLPERIKNQLINNGWNPPGWLDLEATIDAETGDMVMDGAKWALKVTYSGMFGPPDVDSIHTPRPSARLLRKESQPNIDADIKLVDLEGHSIPEGEVAYSQQFLLHVLYEEVPDIPPESIKLEWGEAESSIVGLSPTDQKTLFTSEPLSYGYYDGAILRGEHIK